MEEMFNAVLSKLAAIVDWFGGLFVAFFISAWDILRDMFAWLFDQTLGVAVAAVGAINVTGVSANVQAYGSIPGNVLLVMSCIGLGQALGIITAALAIRFALQLIPFVRLGS